MSNEQILRDLQKNKITAVQLISRISREIIGTLLSGNSLTSKAEVKQRPIGVFDSGVGGLTVLRELYRQLPNESIVYFADTARLPYGIRSAAEILQFGSRDSQLDGTTRGQDGCLGLQYN